MVIRAKSTYFKYTKGGLNWPTIRMSSFQIGISQKNIITYD